MSYIIFDGKSFLKYEGGFKGKVVFDINECTNFDSIIEANAALKASKKMFLCRFCKPKYNIYQMVR